MLLTSLGIPKKSFNRTFMELKYIRVHSLDEAKEF